MNGYKCPKCGELLYIVRESSGYLNEEQFDSIRAGDYYCKSCKGNRGKSGYRYYWENELNKGNIYG